MNINVNEARALPVLLVGSGTQASRTGITEGSVTVKISKNGGASVPFTLTGKWTEISDGVYCISFAAGDLDTKGVFVYIVSATECDQYTGAVFIQDPNDYKADVSNLDAKVSTRAIAGDAMTLAEGERAAIQAQILSDATPFAGANIATLLARLTAARAGYLDNLPNLDAKVSDVDADVLDRAAPGDQMALTAAERTAIQAKILSDATPFPGADIAELLVRLSAARAGYLDNLSAGTVALEATLTAIKGAGWTSETLMVLKEKLDELISKAASPRKADFRV